MKGFHKIPVFFEGWLPLMRGSVEIEIVLKVVEESRNAKEMMGWLEGKIKECKVTFDLI